MNRYQLTIAYDGSDFAGWQEQTDYPAVSNSIHNSFKRVFNVPMSMVGASRTDAGVHALGQVALLKTSLTLEPKILMTVLNRALPNSITIRNAQRAAPSFHPQHNVAQKTYWYHLFLKRPLPFLSRYGLFIEKNISLERLQEALNIFVGTHDFRSFCSGYDQENTIRTINSINVTYIQRFDCWQIEFKGERFLRYMIRRLVGAALDYALKSHLSIDCLVDILHAKNQRHTLANAPAHGLMLAHIRYHQMGQTNITKGSYDV